MALISTRVRWLFAGALAVGFIGFAGGFTIGKRWPLARVQRLIHRWRGDLVETWHPYAVTDLPRFEAARAVVGHTLYVMGGFKSESLNASNRLDALDLTTRTWTHKAPMPNALTHVNAVVIRDTIWLAGGFEGDHPGPATQRVWRYATATDTWSPGPMLPAARGGAALILAGDTLHFVGGWLPDRNTGSTDHWVLVPGDTTWRAAANFPSLRGHLSGIAAADRLYLLGGAVGHDPIPIDTERVDAFDLRTGRWEPSPQAPFAVSHTEPATFVYDGRIVMFGGRSNTTGREHLDDILSFNPASGLWTHLGRMPKGLLGAVAFARGDTFVAGFGASRGTTPDTPELWWTLPRDTWRRADPMPLELGEVAGGIIGDRLYLVGSGNPATLVFNIASGRWDAPMQAATRPARGDHHTAEVINGELWLFGGLDRAAEGAVQIFNPATNRWRLGPRMPFAAGSASSAMIDGKVYIAGGIVGDSTTHQAVVFDPVKETWTPIAPMPRPRNHAAAATDGKRFFIFGGRGPGSGEKNYLANGYDDVQIYDPATNQWTVSDGTPGSPAPLPQARGGMGRAVWLNGEFWMMGGETKNGAGATKYHTYNRVDIYNPATNTWRAGPPMLTPRHGIFPMTHEGMIIVAGGGDHATTSETSVVEIIWPKH